MAPRGWFASAHSRPPWASMMDWQPPRKERFNEAIDEVLAMPDGMRWFLFGAIVSNCNKSSSTWP